MKLHVIALLVFPLTSALGCFNSESSPTVNGDTNGSASGIQPIHLELRMASEPKDYAPELRETKSTSERLEAKALERIYAGHASEAIPLLQKAEETTPGNYSIAANLGTALELVGDNKAALEWIQTALRRNPDSHQGTEWVHVLVLEAKLRDASAPGSGLRTPLVPVPERVDAETPITAGGVSRSATAVRYALFYQLHERMLFVKPKDPYVADLLFSLATIEANVFGVEGAQRLLRLSTEYGFSDGAKIEALAHAIDHAIVVHRVWSIAKWTLGVALFVGFLFYAYRRKWFFLTQSAYRAHQASLRQAAVK